MFYKKTEEYDFMIPREYKAYLAFREKLKDLGVKFIEQHHSMSCTILAYTNGDFEVDDKCNILELISASQDK